MGRGPHQLPHWTWEDLDTALSHFGAEHEAARSTQQHLLQGIREQAPALSAAELLKELVSVAWIVGSVAASVTSRRQGDGFPGSFSSSSSPS